MKRFCGLFKGVIVFREGSVGFGQHYYNYYFSCQEKVLEVLTKLQDSLRKLHWYFKFKGSWRKGALRRLDWSVRRFKVLWQAGYGQRDLNSCLKSELNIQDEEGHLDSVRNVQWSLKRFKGFVVIVEPLSVVYEVSVVNKMFEGSLGCCSSHWGSFMITKKVQQILQKILHVRWFEVYSRDPIIKYIIKSPTGVLVVTEEFHRTDQIVKIIKGHWTGMKKCSKWFQMSLRKFCRYIWLFDCSRDDLVGWNSCW